MNTRWKLLLTLLASLTISACDSLQIRDDSDAADSGSETAAPTTGADAAGEEASTKGMEQGSGFKGDPLDDPQSPLATRVIYFDFDKSDIKEQYKPVLEAHAGYISEHGGASVTLEGHTDERGTREYNLGLGERRAQSVQRFLRLLGVNENQLQTVSFGEERPAALGHFHSAWDQNRRVEIIYRAR